VHGDEAVTSLTFKERFPHATEVRGEGFDIGERPKGKEVAIMPASLQMVLISIATSDPKT
jgi:hypothetical protein